MPEPTAMVRGLCRVGAGGLCTSRFSHFIAGVSQGWSTHCVPGKWRCSELPQVPNRAGWWTELLLTPGSGSWKVRLAQCLTLRSLGIGTEGHLRGLREARRWLRVAAFLLEMLLARLQHLGSLSWWVGRRAASPAPRSLPCGQCHACSGSRTDARVCKSV